MGLLDGVRVVELAMWVAGPLAGRILASQGAEVIALVPRSAPGIAWRGIAVEGESTFSMLPDYMSNKRSISVDLHIEEGREVLTRLLETADVFFDNLSAAGLARFGLTWERLQTINPRLVVLRLPGIGLDGPYSGFASFGVTLQALAGINSASGDAKSNPIGPSAALPDYVSGVQAAMAIAAALVQRKRTGRGAFVELSQFEASVNLLGVEVMGQALTGESAPLVGNRHAFAAPHGVFRCRDEHLDGDRLRDRWCAIAVLTDEQWLALCEVAGWADLAAERSLCTGEGRKAREGELERRTEAWTSERLAWDVFDALDAAGVPVSVVESAADMLNRDAHLAARGHFDLVEMPGIGPLHYHGTPLRFSNASSPGRTAGPFSGADNDYVLMDLLGMSRDEVDHLIAIGAVT